MRDDIPALVMEVVKSLTPAVTNAQASAQGTSTSTTFTGARELTGITAAGTSTNVTTGDTWGQRHYRTEMATRPQQ